MKKFVTFATAGALAFAGLGLGAVNANAAGSEWDDPNAGENYFTVINQEIVGLNDAGKELAKREPVISLPRKYKDKDIIAIGTPLDSYGVKEIKSWGGIKKLDYVGKVKIPDNWGEITTIGGNHPVDMENNTLPKSWGNVTSIGDIAFSNAYTETVLPESWGQVKTIGAYAFRLSKISALPKSWGNVENIGKSAFEDNNLTAIPADWGNVKTIGGWAFFNMGGKTPADYQKLNRIAELPKSWGKVEKVGEFAFAYNRIHAIPDDFAGLKGLEVSVFANDAGGTKLDQEIKSGGVYRLPAESLTADFKKDFFNWVTFDENAKKSVLCTYDGANPNNIKSDFKILINDPERCKEVVPAQPAPKTEAPAQSAPQQPAPQQPILPQVPAPAQPTQPAPKAEPTPAPAQPAPKAEPTPAPAQPAPKAEPTPAPTAVPAPTQTEVKPGADASANAGNAANASAANAANAANASAGNASNASAASAANAANATNASAANAANANGVAAAKQNSAVLANTGSDLTVLGAAGVALLALAGAATLVARRVKH